MQERKNGYLSIGSNQGDRESFLKSAIEALSTTPGLTIIAVSSIYETDPVGYTEQPAFLNAVLKIETTLSPEELLERTQAVENRGGRIREIRYGPRTIDIDLLSLDSVRLHNEQLILPHPRMHERSFVLIPLQEIAPELQLDNGKSLKEQISTLPDVDGVKLWKK